MVACFYTVEQWSAINNRSIASALQVSGSGLCNLNLCVTSGGMQKVMYSYLSALLPVVFWSQCVALIALSQTSQKAYL